MTAIPIPIALLERALVHIAVLQVKVQVVRNVMPRVVVQSALPTITKMAIKW